MSEATVNDLLVHATNKDPVAIKTAFGELVSAKVAERLGIAKQEVAQSYFAGEEESDEDDQDDTTTEEETSDEEEEENKDGEDAETV